MESFTARRFIHLRTPTTASPKTEHETPERQVAALMLSRDDLSLAGSRINPQRVYSAYRASFVAGLSKSDSVVAPDISPIRTQHGKAPGRTHYARRLCLISKGASMRAERHAFDQSRGLQPAPAWAGAWHIWTVIIPRRSITGKLVHGKVWRRHDGRHWIYKKFAEYDE
jgi:hypothetical protein